jgi:hypothetical protein
MARLLQAQSGDPAEQDRLGQIIAAQDPKTRKKQQELAEYEYRRLVDAATDPRDPMSTGEFKRVYDSFKLRHAASNLPMPEIDQYYKKKVEEKDSTAARVNAANAIAKQYGVDSDAIGPLISIDPRTGELDAESIDRAYERAEKLSNPMVDSKARSFAKDQLNAVEAQMELMKQNPDLFADPKDVEPRIRPYDSYMPFDEPDPETVKKYDTVRAEYDELVAKRNDLLGQLAGGLRQAPLPTPEPKPLPKYTQAAPYEVQATTEAERKLEIAAFIKAVKSSSTDQWVRHPLTKKVILIPASK